MKTTNLKRFVNLKPAATTLLSLLILSGCGSHTMTPGTVAKQWSENTSQLGIMPIYPLREGFYPGDIVLLAAYSPKSEVSQQSVPVEFYNIHPIYYDHLDYCKVFGNSNPKPDLPLTKGYPLDGEKTDPWAPPKIMYSHFKCDVSSSTDFLLSESTAFPSFSFASLSQSALGANIVNSGFGARWGGGKNAQNHITYSVPSAEVLSVKTKHLISLFEEYWDNHYKTEYGNIKALAETQALPDKDSQSITPIMAVISEVHYARSINVSISASKAFSTQLSGATMAMIDLSKKKSELERRIQSLSSSTSPPEQVDQKSSEQKTKIDELKHELQEITTNIETLGKAVAPSAPGVTGHVTRSSSSGITLTQVFSKPLAIGYRAVLFEFIGLTDEPADTTEPNEENDIGDSNTGDSDNRTTSRGLNIPGAELITRPDHTSIGKDRNNPLANNQVSSEQTELQQDGQFQATQSQNSPSVKTTPGLRLGRNQTPSPAGVEPDDR
ncbi:hypothetical protein SAMN05216198_1380 [Halopseudomonas litoralis]|uniref:Lipoprotein n=1 Tax=Halopseudomonas litoralis TaxID=797277 RepID=A0A1H1Q4Y3_9GAMM|nr:hypothetical protein [Halopseudomonas litoralis]SDS18317.1 hypothetical protein SAMN05216198_1380 [Halopseudomonas litoralis]